MSNAPASYQYLPLLEYRVTNEEQYKQSKLVKKSSYSVFPLELIVF